MTKTAKAEKTSDVDAEPIDLPADEPTARLAALADERRAADSASNAALVAQRSADIDTEEAKKGEHRKVFVLPPGPKPSKANGFSHEANFAATRQYMISQGLRPTGDVRFVSCEPFGPGGLSWALTYAVPAVPAERFDFQQVHVITENEDPDGDGRASGKTAPDDGTGKKPAESNVEADAKAAAKEAKDAAKKAADEERADGGKKPTV